MDKTRTSTPDVFILVDDYDAIKVWAEQIECALDSLVPKVTTARKGARHLYLKDQYTTCKKLLLMLDTKSDIYRSHIVDTWLKHFSSLKPKDILCVLVDSGTADLSDTELGKGRLNVVKTEDISHFNTWWPVMVEFLFLKTKVAPKVLNYSLETVHTHEDDQLPRRLTQCLDAFVDPDQTNASSTCQTVKVVGGAGDENPQERENMHVVIASLGVDRSIYDQCNSVHTRADVLRCVLFILVDSGIVPFRRFSRKELLRQTCKSLHACASHVVTKIRNTGPVMFLLSFLVFVMNLPGTLLVFCYAISPIGSVFAVSYLVITNNTRIDVCFVIFADVFFLVPFVIVGSLAFADIIHIDLSTTLIIICFFVLPVAYILGWFTIVSYLVKKRLDCEYGIWSLPSHLWSTDYKLPDCCWWLYIPVFVTQLLLSLVSVLTSFGTVCLLFKYRQFIFDKHMLTTGPIITTFVFLNLGFSPYFIVPAGIVGCVYFVSVTRLEKRSKWTDCWT